MACFALYNYQFVKQPLGDSRQSYLKGMEPNVKDADEYFRRKQEIFGELFEKDYANERNSIHFQGKNRADDYSYRYVIRPTHGIIIFRLINVHELSFQDETLKKNVQKDFRDLVVVIDNRPGIQRLAIESNTRAFSNLIQVEWILASAFNEYLKFYGLSIHIDNLQDSNDFWRYIDDRTYGKGFWKVSFHLPPLNLERLKKVDQEVWKKFRSSFGTGMECSFQAEKGGRVKLDPKDKLQTETVKWLMEDVGGNTIRLFPRGGKMIVLGHSSYKYIIIPDSVFERLQRFEDGELLFPDNEALDSVKSNIESGIKDT